MLKTLSNIYLLKNLAQDLLSAVSNSGLASSISELDFDRERWLNKAGLSLHRPGAKAASGASLLLVGAVVGGVAALLFATKTGPELRTQIRERALDLKDRAKDLAQRNSSELTGRIERISEKVSDVRL
jgi:hypothetical protein